MLGNHGIRYHALNLGLVFLVGGTFWPGSLSAARRAEPAPLPDLPSFIVTVTNGDASMLRGVYAEGLFALPVSQQPSQNATYVSSAPADLTQFSSAAAFGNVGLLAHNYLSGGSFFQLQLGQSVDLVYGDGRIESYRVTHILRYRALRPLSTDGDFVDLDSQQQLSAQQLFQSVYMGARHVIFQTCITMDGNLSWGRLFVIAEPQRNLDKVAQAY